MPMILSNRSLIIGVYAADLPDGYKAAIISSQGNEALAEQLAEAIGSDVIAS